MWTMTLRRFVTSPISVAKSLGARRYAQASNGRPPSCGRGLLGGAHPEDAPLVDVLTEHDIDTVGVPNLELADLVGPIRRLVEHVSASIPDLSIVRVNFTYPLEQMDASRGTLATSRQMDRRVVSPDDRILLVAKVPIEAKDVAIVSRGRLYIGNVQYGSALNELLGM